MTLFSPLVFLGFTLLFVGTLMLKIAIVHSFKPDGRTLKQKLGKKKKQIVSKIAGILCTALVVAAIFFLRTMVAGLDCSLMQDGRMYLDKEPQTLCETDVPNDDGVLYYAKIWFQSILGIIIFTVCFVALCLGMAFGERKTFAFLAEKMDPAWFWWELVLLARKLTVMIIALRTSEHPEQGWFLCSFVLVMALSAHSFARPYREGWLNGCEYSSLFSTLLLFQAGMVFKVDNDIQSEDSQTDAAEAQMDMFAQMQDAEVTEDNTLGELAKMLVWVAMGLISMTTGLCMFVAVKLMCEKHKTYAERRKRQLAADRARSGEILPPPQPRARCLAGLAVPCCWPCCALFAACCPAPADLLAVPLPPLPAVLYLHALLRRARYHSVAWLTQSIVNVRLLRACEPCTPRWSRSWCDTAATLTLLCLSSLLLLLLVLLLATACLSDFCLRTVF